MRHRLKLLVTHCKVFQRSVSPLFNLHRHRTQVHWTFDHIRVTWNLFHVDWSQEERVVILPGDSIRKLCINWRLEITHRFICVKSFVKTSLRGFNLTGLESLFSIISLSKNPPENCEPRCFPALSPFLDDFKALREGSTRVIPVEFEAGVLGCEIDGEPG